MKLKFTRHALVDSMPDEKISVQEVRDSITKSELTVRLRGNKYKFRYQDVEVVCRKIGDYWLVITCYRVR